MHKAVNFNTNDYKDSTWTVDQPKGGFMVSCIQSCVSLFTTRISLAINLTVQRLNVNDALDIL